MIKYGKEYFDDCLKTVDAVSYVEQLKGKSILMTGCTGMICSAVVDLLLTLNRFRKFDLHVILAGRSFDSIKNRFYEFKSGRDYQFLQYDATKQDNITIKVDYIIHGASNASPKMYLQEPVETMLSNIIGLNVLLKCVSANKESRLLYISSSEVYGQKKNDQPYFETDYGFVDILNQRACYPSSKRAAETLCVAYGTEYSADVVIARPGHIYGPTITVRDDRASAQFTRMAKQGSNIVLKSSGSQLRSYCYTADCASALLAILLKGESGNAYNISNAASVVTIRDLAQALADVAGTKLTIEEATSSEKKGYNMMSNSSLNAAKLESLGWHAIYSLQEGIRRTLDYYVES